MTRGSLFTPLGLLLLLASFAAPAAASEELLAEKGLSRLNNQYLLAGEAEFNKLYRELADSKRTLDNANKALLLVERKVDASKRMIVTYTQQRIVLRQQLANARSVDQHNQIVNAMNELADRITLLTEGGEFAEELKAARGTANQAREDYVQRVLAVQALYDGVQSQYEDLAADPRVTEALAALSTAEKTYSLGPTRSFTLNGAALKRIGDTVLSEAIPITRGESDLLYVSTVFNDKYAHEIVLDTGSSLMLLPAKMATDMGIEVSATDPDIRLQMADGRIIEAKQILLKKVRVGKFEMADVECAVIPAEYTAVQALLGQSFLRHFSYKVEPDQGRLVMVKIEDAKR